MANQATNMECEICDEMALCYYHSNIWMCNACWIKEQKAKIESFSVTQTSQVLANQSVSPTTIEINSVLKESATIDSTIQVRTDIFNAKTKSIIELKSTIDSDETIPNKPYALAECLKNRFNHLKSVIFEKNQEITDMGNEQKAIQVYLNGLANQLRAEEREKLKIADINYQPTNKVIKTRPVGTSGTKKVKFDKAALKLAAKELGLSEFTIQSVAVAKGCSVAEAVIKIRASIEATKQA